MHNADGDKNTLDEIGFHLFLEAIYAKYGYDLRGYVKASMKRRVFAALQKSGLRDLSELQGRILADADFFARVLEDLTVRVSSMFRDPKCYQVFRERVVPVLRTYPLLKIWHAGCATGEEAYATAIVLYEEGLYDRSQLYATDLSPQALTQGMHGHYDAQELDQAAEDYKKSGGRQAFSDYYTTAYDHCEMKEFLRRNILFFQHNLVSDHEFGRMHVIFCRNVLIYFDPALKEQIFAKFSSSLCPGGFLCLGSSERLSTTGSRQAFVDFMPEARIYRGRAE